MFLLKLCDERSDLTNISAIQFKLICFPCGSSVTFDVEAARSPGIFKLIVLEAAEILLEAPSEFRQRWMSQGNSLN